MLKGINSIKMTSFLIKSNFVNCFKTLGYIIFYKFKKIHQIPVFIQNAYNKNLLKKYN